MVTNPKAVTPNVFAAWLIESDRGGEGAAARAIDAAGGK